MAPSKTSLLGPQTFVPLTIKTPSHAGATAQLVQIVLQTLNLKNYPYRLKSTSITTLTSTFSTKPVGSTQRGKSTAWATTLTHLLSGAKPLQTTTMMVTPSSVILTATTTIRNSTRPIKSSNHGLIEKVGTQPSLRFFNGHTTALGIISELVSLNLSNTKILGLRVRKIPAANGGCRHHCHGLCQ